MLLLYKGNLVAVNGKKQHWRLIRTVGWIQPSFLLVKKVHRKRLCWGLSSLHVQKPCEMGVVVRGEGNGATLCEKLAGSNPVPSKWIQPSQLRARSSFENCLEASAGLECDCWLSLKLPGLPITTFRRPSLSTGLLHVAGAWKTSFSHSRPPSNWDPHQKPCSACHHNLRASLV